jgi:hypothetical protein
MNQLEISFGSPLRIVIAQEEPQAVIVSWLTIWYGDFKVKAKGDVMYTMPVDKMVKMQVSYVDARGNPAVVDGPVTWTSSDETIIKVRVDASDSTMVMVVPAGAVGQAQVVATADADLGAGVRSLVTTADIDIVAGEAVAGTITPVGEATPV